MKNNLLNSHVIDWCNMHVKENDNDHRFFKNGAVDDTLDEYRSQLFGRVASSKKSAQYYGWLTYMAKLALKAEMEGRCYTCAITDPIATQEKRIAAKKAAEAV